MRRETEPLSYIGDDGDPGPGMGASFAISFLADLATSVTIGFFPAQPFLDFDSKLSIVFAVVVPLAANAPAIRWAAATKRHRCLKGLILSTSLLVLLDGACFGLTR